MAKKSKTNSPKKTQQLFEALTKAFVSGKPADKKKKDIKKKEKK